MTSQNFYKLSEKYILPLLSAAAVLRKEKQFRKLLIIASEKSIKPSRIYEALLQIYLFAGFPTALISLRMYSEYFNYSSKLENFNIKSFTSRGIKNCKKVYSRKYERLISNVNSFSPELSEWLIIEGYGKTLGRKKLPMKERELCIVSILTVMMFEDQLISHMKGAFHCGNTKTDILNTIGRLELIGEKSKALWGKKVFNKVKF